MEPPSHPRPGGNRLVDADLGLRSVDEAVGLQLPGAGKAGAMGRRLCGF